ncbi:hypothetical protein MASR1M29_11500 [Cloacibacterium normanense]|jgi:hypothetical protein
MNLKISFVQTLVQLLILSVGYYLLEVFVRKNNLSISDYFSNYWVYAIAAFVGLLIINFFWNKSDLKKTKP